MKQEELQRMAAAIAGATGAGSITPQEVGELFTGVIDYISEVAREGGALGVRKIYTSVEAMKADSAPKGEGDKPLRPGNLVAIYDKTKPAAKDNGRIFVYTGAGFEQLAQLSVQVSNDYSDEDKAKVKLIQTDGDPNSYLSADGSYKPIHVPEAPIQSLSVGGVKLEPDAQGNVDLTIPKAPVQGVAVNGSTVAPDEAGIINIETKSGTVQSVIFNGAKQLPDEAGAVHITTDIVEVDDTLSAESTNAVSNAAVSAKFQELSASSISALEAQLSEDETSVTLKLLNKEGGEVASASIPAGGKGGGGDAPTTRIVLSASVDKPQLKVGDSALLSYSYSHVTADSEAAPTGQRATLNMILRRGATILLERVTPEVSAGSYSLDLTPYLTQAGTLDVLLSAEVSDPEGKTQRRNIATSVRAYSISLSTSHPLAEGLVGYAPGTILNIPYLVTGVGNKTVTLYIDGKAAGAQSVTRSGATSGSLQHPLTSLSEGRHTAQLVAELSLGAEELKSESIYFDFYVGATQEQPRIGILMRREDGHIFGEAEHLAPELLAEQFARYSFSYGVYDPLKQPASLSLKVGSAAPSILSVARGAHDYESRASESGRTGISLSTRLGVSYELALRVKPGKVSVSEVSDSLSLALSALGRSNSEENPALWQSGDVAARFLNFDWSAGGWMDGALHLTGRSELTIPAAFFARDPMTAGASIELELKTSSPRERSSAVFSCVDSRGVGIVITPGEARLKTSSGAEVATKFAAGEWYRLAFVVHPKGATRLLEIYINGIRSGVVSYGQGDSLLQAEAMPFRASAEAADLDLRALRLYSRALTDDELLGNYIASRPDPSELIALYERNEVLGERGEVSLEKLRSQGKSVLRIVGNVPLVNETNNKKYEEQVDVYFYSGFGKEYDFVCKGAGLRIQGTSSTTYPRKNYRIYLDRKKKYNTTLTVGGVEQKELKYAFSPGAVPVSIFTIKADFAESSSTHNTGLAKLIDEAFRKAGILTPPQKTNKGVRIAVDGFPCDAFFAGQAAGENTYLGKYNFNNDKAGSEAVFGFSGEDCICLEFLNNSEPLALFTTDNMAAFKTALEFRHPDGLKWDAASETQKGAVRRLWSWIQSCKGKPTKFQREVADYFDVESLCGWYVMTEYFMMVDQRAKNMMLATWDARKWYFLPYDNDTVLGVRNDGKLVYDYTIDEESFDETIGSYAYAGHDSLLWQLVRQALPSQLNEVAQKIRGAMSKEHVLEVLNGKFMGNWPERVYNKDGEYKYLTPFREQAIDYLYCLQGARYAHRTAIIGDRFALLDAQHLAGTYRADALRLYFSHKFSSDKKRIGITASERYYFGYGYTSKAPQVSGVRADMAGSKVTLTLDTDLIVNDPQNLYGASRMAGIDLSEVSAYIVGTANFDRCTQLRALDLSCSTGQQTLTAITLGACSQLEQLKVAGLKAPSLRSLDLSANSRLKSLDASNTGITDITLASGAPITELRLPDTLTTLRLVHLPLLSREGLKGLRADGITRLWFEGCPLISWEQLLEELSAVTHLRIVGIKMEGSASWLTRFLGKGGLSASGALTTTCALVGSYRLTEYLEEEELARLTAHFPELSIQQPEYTVIGYYNRWTSKEGLPVELSVMDKWFNRDNGTGYGTGKPYKPSGHILRIAAARHRWRGIEARRGEMVVYQLRDEHSGYYADATELKRCTPSDLSSAEEGGLWVNEPHYWYKGVHDGETGTDYHVYSSLLERPRMPEGKLYTSAEVISVLKPVLQHYIRVPKGTKADGSVAVESLIYKHLAAYTNEEDCNTYSYIKIPLEGYKRVRFPLCNNGYTDSDDASIGVQFPTEKQPAPFQSRYRYERGVSIAAVFTNAEGKVIRIIRLSNKEYPIMYRDYVAAVPKGATHLYTSVLTELIDEELDIWLTSSDKPEDWEPHWQEHQETWIAATPLHWQPGETLPSMRMGEDIPIGRRDEERWIFYLRHGHYDNVSYEDFKDLRNLLYAQIGSFDLTGHYGRAADYISSSRYRFWSLPEAGMNGTTPRTTQGKLDSNIAPGVNTDDGLGTVTRKTCFLPSALGYTWIITGVCTPLTSPHRDGRVLGATKNMGIDFSRDLRRQNTQLTNHPWNNKLIFTEDFRNASVQRTKTPRRIIHLRGEYNSEQTAMEFIREPLGGRYLDLLPRRVHSARVPGLATGATIYLHLSDTDQSILSTEENRGSYEDQMEFTRTRTPLAKTIMVPVFRGKVIKARTLAELRALKNYQFLLDEKADFTKW